VWNKQSRTDKIRGGPPV